MLKQLILFWLFTFFIYANHVHWKRNYDKALELSKKENKPLLVLVVKKASNQCNKIIKNCFMHQPYIKIINQKMIPVIVTYNEDTSYPIEMYYTTVFPTLFFVDAKTETFIREPLYGMKIKSNLIKASIESGFSIPP